MAWGCKHDGPCGWAYQTPAEWWCDVCERDALFLPEPSAGRATPEETTP